MQIKLKIELKVKELYDFLIFHTYTSVSGWLGVILSIGAIAGFIYSLDNDEMNIAYKFVLLVIGLLFTVIQPIMLYKRAKAQVKQNEAINKPLEYTITQAGMRVACGDDFVDYNWDQIMKISSTKTNVLVYTNRVRAFILPKRELNPYMEDFKKIVREKCTATSIKVK